MTDQEILYRFGRNLLDMRTRRGLSAAQVGMLLGISADAVRKYERGDRELGILRIVRAKEQLNCSYMSMLQGLDASSLEYGTGMEFNVLSPVASGIMQHLATQWNGDIEALVIFMGMIAAWPEEIRRELYLQASIQNDALLANHIIPADSMPPGMEYMLSGIGKLFDK